MNIGMYFALSVFFGSVLNIANYRFFKESMEENRERTQAVVKKSISEVTERFGPRGAMAFVCLLITSLVGASFLLWPLFFLEGVLSQTIFGRASTELILRFIEGGANGKK